jgi:hypothetical protein
MSDFKDVLTIAASFALAVMGGLARILSKADSKPGKIAQVLSNLFVSAFAGAMLGLGARALGWSASAQAVAGGVGGYIGTAALDTIWGIAISAIKL